MKPSSCRFSARSLACALVAILGASSALAQTVEWSGGGLATSNSWGQAGNWNGGSVPAAGSNILIATGNFTPATNSTDTMALNLNREVGSITFDNSAGQFPSVLRLNANTGNGSNNGTFRNLTINRDASNVVFNVVNGANVFISGNSSTLTTSFAGLNLTLNYTGMGTINIDGSSSMIIGGNAAGFRTAAGQNAGLMKTGAGTLTMGGASANYTGGFHLAGGTLLISASSNLTNAAQPGPFGNGTLTIDGGTKLASTINSTSNVFRTFDNAVVFTGGTVTLGDTVNNGGISFSTGVNSGGTSALQADTVLNVLSSVTINRSLSGSGSLTKTGSGVLNLNQQASYTGGTILREGSLQLGADYLPSAGAVTFDGGILRVGNSGFTSGAHATTVTANGGTFSISGVLALTWAGDISGVGGVTMTGTGFLNLTGNNTYSGGTNITQGTVRGSIGTGNLAIASGAAYGLNGADRSTAAISGSGNITLGANTLTTDSSSDSSFDGVISGSGGLTKSGTSTLTLAGANTYSGTTTVNAGTLRGSVGSGDLSVASGAAYELGGGDRSVGGLSGSGNILLGANTLTTNGTADSTFSGVISGSAGITKEGAGTLTLSGANSYSGTTAVSAGTLRGNVGSGALAVSSGASYDLGGANRSVAALSGSGNVLLGANTLTTSSTADSTFSGVISGSAGVTKEGSGTLTLSGANTYSGGTRINAGTVKGRIGTGDLTVAAGSTYDLDGEDREIGSLEGEGQVNLGARILTSNSSASSTHSGVISGSGGLTKSGSGSLTLSGANSYSGTTTVNAGTLRGRVGSGDLSVASGAAYELGGGDRSVGGLSGSGTVALGANTLTTHSNTNTAFSGSINGTGGLTKTGSGRLTLSGTQSYSGPTTISAGSLVMNGTLSSSVSLASGTTLSGTGSFLNSVSLSGTHNPGNSAGIQTFTSLTYNAGSAINWELAANTVTQAQNPSAAFDQIMVTDTLTFAGDTALQLVFNSAGSTVTWLDTFWQSAHSWEIFSSTNTVNASNIRLAIADWTDSAGNSFNSTLGANGGAFDLSFIGNSVLLNYNLTPIPEPSTYAMIMAAASVVAVGVWRRRQRRS